MAPGLAYLGLGNMGQAMCGNLVRKGNLSSPLILYNRTVSRASELSNRLGNCVVCYSVVDAVADADIIFSCLTDDSAVFETFTEILKHEVKGKLFVSCSTTQPETSDKLASMVESRGAGLVTMPGRSSVTRSMFRAMASQSSTRPQTSCILRVALV
ncbi:MAG: hypothetical protein Q9191_001808 [Dirinaria sp. TL-2023a]